MLPTFVQTGKIFDFYTSSFFSSLQPDTRQKATGKKGEREPVGGSQYLLPSSESRQGYMSMLLVALFKVYPRSRAWQWGTQVGGYATSQCFCSPAFWCGPLARGTKLFSLEISTNGCRVSPLEFSLRPSHVKTLNNSCSFFEAAM